jgi:hypothetical protein
MDNLLITSVRVGVAVAVIIHNIQSSKGLVQMIPHATSTSS